MEIHIRAELLSRQDEHIHLWRMIPYEIPLELRLPLHFQKSLSSRLMRLSLHESLLRLQSNIIKILHIIWSSMIHSLVHIHLYLSIYMDEKFLDGTQILSHRDYILPMVLEMMSHSKDLLLGIPLIRIFPISISIRLAT